MRTVAGAGDRGVAVRCLGRWRKRLLLRLEYLSYNIMKAAKDWTELKVRGPHNIYKNTGLQPLTSTLRTMNSRPLACGPIHA